MAKLWAKMSAEEKLDSVADLLNENTDDISLLKTKLAETAITLKKYESSLRKLAIQVFDLQEKAKR